MKECTCTHKAQYYETDQMGVVHHSNYIRWFEEARVEFMDAIGYTYKQMEKDGIISPVLEVNAKYHSMVHFEDTVKITTRLDSFNGIKMVVSYSITDVLTGELRTTGYSRHCFLNTDGRPLSLKKSFPKVYDILSGCLDQ